jgi:hypothetical protein
MVSYSAISISPSKNIGRFKWRQRFLARRLDGLSDEPQPGVPPTIIDAQVEWVIAKTLEETPRGATQWSTRSMAEASGLSRASIWRIRRPFGLQAHQVEFFKLSPDPFLVATVRDIVGLYLDPPEPAAVLCVDEKSQIQALERTQPLLPMRAGVAEPRSHDYYRRGTTSLFAAYEIITGQVRQLRRRHRATEFGDFRRRIHESVPDDLAVHLILDNYATHNTPAFQCWLLRHPRVHLQFTPTSGRPFNLVEHWFADLTSKCIRCGSHRSEHPLVADVATAPTEVRPAVRSVMGSQRPERRGMAGHSPYRRSMPFERPVFPHLHKPLSGIVEVWASARYEGSEEVSRLDGNP